MAIRVAAIYRYPVKGLSAEPLMRTTLAPGDCLPQDRRFAIARASAVFDPARPEWLPKSSFLMLMRDEKLAQLRTRFDEPTGVLTIERGGHTLLVARLAEDDGRRAVSGFFDDFVAASTGDAPSRVVEAPGHAFLDARRKPNASTSKYVSIVNLASIGALEKAIGAPVDPIRFRANVYIEGAPAWSEFDWVDGEITLGPARLHVVSRIVRCPATAVNPVTAQRDLDVPELLRREFTHQHMGVYAEVMAGGDVARGDELIAPA